MHYASASLKTAAAAAHAKGKDLRSRERRMVFILQCNRRKAGNYSPLLIIMCQLSHSILVRRARTADRSVRLPAQRTALQAGPTFTHDSSMSGKVTIVDDGVALASTFFFPNVDRMLKSDFGAAEDRN